MSELKRKPIFISINPTDVGYECNVLPPTDMPKLESYAVALTMAYGMVKAAIQEPNYIFDFGVDAMSETEEDYKVKFEDILKRRKEKLH